MGLSWDPKIVVCLRCLARWSLEIWAKWHEKNIWSRSWCRNMFSVEPFAQKKTGIFVAKRQRRICSVGKVGMYIAIATLIAMQDVYQSFVFFHPIRPKSWRMSLDWQNVVWLSKKLGRCRIPAELFNNSHLSICYGTKWQISKQESVELDNQLDVAATVRKKQSGHFRIRMWLWVQAAQ